MFLPLYARGLCGSRQQQQLALKKQTIHHFHACVAVSFNLEPSSEKSKLSNPPRTPLLTGTQALDVFTPLPDPNPYAVS